MQHAALAQGHPRALGAVMATLGARFRLQRLRILNVGTLLYGVDVRVGSPTAAAPPLPGPGRAAPAGPHAVASCSA